MMRVNFLIFFYVFNSALSEPATWLMQGDVLDEDEAISRLVQLNSHKSYLPVSTRAEVYYRALPDKEITCVIAASVHQQGHVSVVDGGCGEKMVRIRYTTKTGLPDVFFILVQAAKRKPVSVDGNAARSSLVDIVYEPIRDWNLTEIQNALHNSTNIFPS